MIRVSGCGGAAAGRKADLCARRRRINTFDNGTGGTHELLLQGCRRRSVSARSPCWRKNRYQTGKISQAQFRVACLFSHSLDARWTQKF